MEFEGGVVASFTMAAFNGWGGGRAIRVMGTKGMLRASTSDKEIYYENAEAGTSEMLPVDVGTGATIVDGHGGGDRGIMNVFSHLVAGDYEGVSAATIATSCDNHMIVFAAEESRKEGKVVSVPEYAARYGI